MIFKKGAVGYVGGSDIAYCAPHAVSSAARLERAADPHAKPSLANILDKSAAGDCKSARVTYRTAFTVPARCIRKTGGYYIFGERGISDDTLTSVEKSAASA